MAAFPQDSEWLAAFRRGERQALERVYRTHVRGIERYLRALARTSLVREFSQSTAIADFLQEAFVRAFSPTARRNYDGVRDYGAYLTTIARNCFVDALRAHGRQVLHTQEEWLLRVDDGGQPSDDGLDPRVRAVLDRYIADLPTQLKRVYEYRFERGQSQDDSCAGLEISRSALRTRENHLRRGLRKALARAGISLSELQSQATPATSLVAHVPHAGRER